MSDSSVGRRSIDPLTGIMAAGAVLAVVAPYALAWELSARLTAAAIAAAFAGGLGLCWVYVRLYVKDVAPKFKISGFPGLAIGVSLLVSGGSLLSAWGTPSVGTAGIPPHSPAVSAGPTSTTTPTVSPTATVSAKPPVLESASPVPPSPTSPSGGATGASSVQLADRVALAVSKVDKNSSPASVSLTVQNDSGDTYSFRLDEGDVSVTDDVHSVYKQVRVQDTESRLYCNNSYCNQQVNSGLRATVDVLIADQLSPKATVLIITIAKVGAVPNVVLRAALPR